MWLLKNVCVREIIRYEVKKTTRTSIRFENEANVGGPISIMGMLGTTVFQATAKRFCGDGSVGEEVVIVDYEGKSFDTKEKRKILFCNFI